MALAIFDLDNTLIAGDSDYLWGVFLAEQGIVDRDFYERENQRFYQEYKDGKLDIFEFLAFSLKPLADNEPPDLQRWHASFMQQKILPLIGDPARALVEKHRQAGDTLLVITATNAFVTAPIVQQFGIQHLIATQPEIIDGRYTGRVAGTPCYQEGKVERLSQWLAQHNENTDGAWFYSDSHNDLPLLRRVDHPVAVDPDEILVREATAAGWPIISLHAKHAPA